MRIHVKTKVCYDKNECGFKCMVEVTEYGQFMGRSTEQLKRGVSFQRFPTKKQALGDAMSALEKVMF